MRKDLNMSPGKLAAQVGHCAEAYWTNQMRRTAYPVAKRVIRRKMNDLFRRKDDDEIGGYKFEFIVDKDVFEDYINESFVKTICAAKNKNHLLKARDMAIEMGLVEDIDFGLIRDNCLTELEPEDEDGRTTTGIWFKPLPDEMSHVISRKYQLYR